MHGRERPAYLSPAPDYFHRADLTTPEGETLPEGFEVERVDRTLAHEMMTPVVFSVTPHTPAAKVVEDMLALKVHRLFVVDPDGVLVGVISALDVLRHLRPEAARAAGFRGIGFPSCHGPSGGESDPTKPDGGSAPRTGC